MIKRAISRPEKTFFLFGPRGTGKSTWIKEQYPDAIVIDLLKSSMYLKFSNNPDELNGMLASAKKGSWVFIDEVQRVPELLNEVHSLYESKGLHFILSGSSARKLKRSDANLLGGRALQRFMFPFIETEYKPFWSMQNALEWGTLPLVVSDPKHKKETLHAYVETYLRQELVEEGILRKVEPFVRFLNVAGQYNGQVLNLENVSRESKVKRNTVASYFQVLEDTLIGTHLPAYQPGIKAKETTHPKFYFFDPGVARSCAGLVDEELPNELKGFALETLIFNELRAYNHYREKNKPIYFYRISGGFEIDFIIESKRKTLSTRSELICLEVKLATKWDSRWNEAMNNFSSHEKFKVKAKYGIYLGAKELQFGDVTVLPFEVFLKRLQNGEIF